MSDPGTGDSPPDPSNTSPTSHSTSGEPREILHILPQFPYFGGHKVVGGYPSLVLSLADAQVATRGHSVRILSRTLPNGPTSTSEGVELLSVGTVDGSAGRIIAGLWFAIRASWRARRLRAPGLVCHVHAGYADYLLIAIIARWFGLRNVVVTLYCPIAEHGMRRRVQRRLLKMAATRVTLTGMSRNVAATMSAAIGGTTAVEHTPPLLDLEHFSPAEHPEHPGSADRPATGPTDSPTTGPVKLIFVGNASPEKGLHDLLHAFAALTATHPELTLTVTTELKRTSSDQRVADTAQLADELGITDRCTFLGVVDDMRDLLRSHHIQVAPFRTTQGPSDYFVATLEAMACGLVAVASDLPGMREIIIDGDNGFLAEPNHPAALEQALHKALHVAGDDTMARKSRATIVRQCSPDDVLTRWDNLYWSTP